MMTHIRRCFKRQLPSLSASQLHNEQTFYRAFEQDLAFCRDEAIIESPFTTLRRINNLLPAIQKAVTRGVTVTVNTKPLQEHDDYMRLEAEEGIVQLQNAGVTVLSTGGHHRKLAIFDRRILWEGSLNILSQNDSCEIMRRTYSESIAQEVIDFTGLRRFLD